VFSSLILILLQKRISHPRDRTLIVPETDAPSVEVLYWSQGGSFLACRLIRWHLSSQMTAKAFLIWWVDIRVGHHSEAPCHSLGIRLQPQCHLEIPADHPGHQRMMSGSWTSVCILASGKEWSGVALSQQWLPVDEPMAGGEDTEWEENSCIK
jgi:hypothetical protein